MTSQGVQKVTTHFICLLFVCWSVDCLLCVCCVRLSSICLFLQMAHMLFHEAGLMETFKIPQREFVNYFRALETNYGSNVCESPAQSAALETPTKLSECSYK